MQDTLFNFLTSKQASFISDTALLGCPPFSLSRAQKYG